MKYAAHVLVFTIAMLSALAVEKPPQTPASPTQNRFIESSRRYFFAAKLPRNMKSEFSVDGNAGQFLRVWRDENAEYDAPSRSLS